MKGENISIRLRRFAAQVVRLCQAFPKGPAAKHILGDFAGVGSGISANLVSTQRVDHRRVRLLGRIPLNRE